MPRRALPFLPLLLAALAACHPAPPREALDGQQLATHARQLASLGSEAVLLTQELAAGHLDTAYPWVQQQALANEAGRIADGLAQPAAPQLHGAQQEAMQLAGRLQLTLTRIAPAQRHPQELQALAGEFRELQAQARTLGGTP